MSGREEHWLSLGRFQPKRICWTQQKITHFLNFFVCRMNVEAKATIEQAVADLKLSKY